MAAVTGSEKERELNASLFHALMENDEDVVIELCRQESTSNGPLHVTSIHKDTVLHLACYSKQHHLAEELLKNDVGNTVLHEAATSNSMTQVATVLIAKQRKLLTKRNILGETPLFPAVRFGKIKMFKLLAHEVDKDNQGASKEQLQSKDGTSILHIAVITEHFAKWRWEWPIWKEVRDEKNKRVSAWELAEKLIKYDTSWEVIEDRLLNRGKPYPEKIEDSSSQQLEEKTRDCCCKKNITAGVKRDETPLFLAIMWKIPDMVEKILKSYPQAAEHINEKGRNILHVAIQYRQMKIFDKVMKDEMLTRRLLRATDPKGNSVLHMVAKKRKGLEEKMSQAPAFELQEQLLLFEKVKGLVKSDFVRLFNHKNRTADELFVDNYSKLHEESKEWTKRTSENCSLVGVLIATVAFAAAYTVPGGNQSTGIPVLLSQPFFVVFTLADIISLTLALTSVHSLVQKLMMGFTFLILSVTMMMVAFGATIILTIHNKENWTQIALHSVAFLPVIIFAVTYSPLYVQLVKACRHFWKFMKKIFPDPCGSSSSLPPNESLSTISFDPPQSQASCSRRPSTSQTTNVEV
ncbi:hypothetical protein PVL29_021465 [Vitis rotundifolia]|uniref:PGG domain-containing protein n=1 Tax=Vitis rotundifolia TaxID=103349 RepID=A0AA39DDB2_VITRO|nr:hypothetical protein PVL29_021465 [Vitis rotundifolia]